MLSRSSAYGKEKLHSNRLSDFLLLQFVHKRLNLCIPNPVHLVWCRKQTSGVSSKFSRTKHVRNIIIEMSFANIFTKVSKHNKKNILNVTLRLFH